MFAIIYLITSILIKIHLFYILVSSKFFKLLLALIKNTIKSYRNFQYY